MGGESVLKMASCPECGQDLIAEDVTNIVASGKRTFTKPVCQNPKCSKSPLFKPQLAQNDPDDI
jgi:hypothetical protein